MNQKTFIVALDKTVALDVAKSIISIDDDFSISPMFTTDMSEQSLQPNENYIIHTDNNTVNLSYKNNSLLFIKTNGYVSEGIMFDDFFNNDICIMNIEEFNLIPESLFNKYGVLTVWIDTKKTSKLTMNDMTEIKYFNDFIESHDHLYFFENEPDIANTLIMYMKGTTEERQHILEENI